MSLGILIGDRNISNREFARTAVRAVYNTFVPGSFESEKRLELQTRGVEPDSGEYVAEIAISRTAEVARGAAYVLIAASCAYCLTH